MNAASILTFLANHLWQSTLFAAVVAVLVSALKHNAARIRFCLWLAASLKFVIPFSVLVTLGTKLARNFATPSVVPVNLSALFASLTRPFEATPPDATSIWPVVIGILWLGGSLLFAVRACRHWLTVAGTVRVASLANDDSSTAALRRAKRALNIQKHLPVAVSAGTMEPGLFG